MSMSMKLEPQKQSVNILKTIFNTLFKKNLSSGISSNFNYRKINLIKQIDFLIDTLHMNKLDIVYMEKLKMPLSPDEKLYFLQQIDRINSSIKILMWFRDNIESNKKFWTKFLKWTNI